MGRVVFVTFVFLSVELCVATAAAIQAFDVNIVQGGNALVGDSEYNYWAQRGPNCEIKDGFFTVSPIPYLTPWKKYDCYMTQTIDVTFASHRFLRSGKKINISAEVNFLGGDPDNGYFYVSQLECTTSAVLERIGQEFMVYAFMQYSRSTMLLDNVCNLRVELHFRNHDIDLESPRANFISVVLTEISATVTNDVTSTTTISASKELPTATESITSQSTSLTLSRSLPTPSQSASAQITEGSDTLTHTLSEALTASAATGSTMLTVTSRLTLSASATSITLSTNASNSYSSYITDTVNVTSTRTSAPTQSLTEYPTKTTRTAVFCGALDDVYLVTSSESTIHPVDDQQRTKLRVNSDQATITFTAEPIARDLLLTAPALTVALLVSDSMRWEVAQTVLGDDRIVATQVDVVRSGVWIVTLRPPLISQNGNISAIPEFPWIPATVGIFQSAVVVLTLHLRCVTTDYHNVTTRRKATITIAAQAPGQQQLLGQQVVTSTVLRAQLVGTVAGAGTASAGARLAAFAVAQCVTGDGGVNGLIPLDLAAPVHCSLTAAQNEDVAAIAGNWIVVVLGSTAAMLCCGVVAVAAKVSLIEAMRLITFPMCVLPLWMAAVPSSTAAAAHLAASSSGACGAIAAAGTLLPVVVVSALWASQRYLLKHYQCCEVPEAVKPSTKAHAWRSLHSFFVWWVLKHVEVFLRHRGVWIAAPAVLPPPADPFSNDSDASGDTFSDFSDAANTHDDLLILMDAKVLPMRHVDALASEFRWVGYSIVDIAIIAVVSTLAGAALGAGTYAWCISSLGVSLLLFVAQLVLCATQQPYMTWFYFAHSIAVQGLTTLGVALNLSSAVVNARTPKDIDVLRLLSQASAVCSLLAVGVVAARALIDVRSLLTALYRLMWRLEDRRAASPHLEGVANGGNDSAGALPLIAVEEELLLPIIGDVGVLGGVVADTARNDEYLSQGDDSFWDPDGNFFMSAEAVDPTSLIILDAADDDGQSVLLAALGPLYVGRECELLSDDIDPLLTVFQQTD